MINTIIFDFGGVLVEIDYPGFLQRMTTELKIPIEEISKNVNSHLHREYMKGNISSEDYYKAICQRHNISLSIDKFKELWNTILVRQNDDVAAIVAKLNQSNYKLALLSNIDPWHYDYGLENFSVVGTFKQVFLSYKQHLLKPDPQYFKYVAEQLNTPPDNCLFIDDLRDNVDAAKGVGFNVIQFKNATQLQQDLESLGVIIPF